MARASLPTLIDGNWKMHGPQAQLTEIAAMACSIGELAVFIMAYPINWWLVANGIKHGMATVVKRLPGSRTGKTAMAHSETEAIPPPSMIDVALVSALSIGAFALAYAVSGFAFM
jgi:hypothetical protein